MSDVKSLWGVGRRELSFGFISAAFSGFGQTYFVALFLVSIVSAIGISEGVFGYVYSGATLVAAGILPAFGRWLDGRGERVSFIIAGFGLALCLGMLAVASSLWALFPALLGLRAFGQGAMALMSATVIAKHFQRRRGVALGIANLGFPFCEMLLPGLTLAMISFAGWRATLLSISLAVGVGVVLISALLLSRPFRTTAADQAVREPAGTPAPRVRFAWWRDPFFMLITSASLIMPLGGTITMLYLAPISLAKGWTLDWIGAGFVLFACVRAGASLLVGPLIDHFGAARIFPYSFVPFSAAVMILIVAPTPWIGLGFFVCVGLAFGAGTVMTALLVEHYGARRLGEIRSVASAAAVLSTAVGPFAAGLAINFGNSFTNILIALFVLSIVCLVAAMTVPGVARRLSMDRSASGH